MRLSLCTITFRHHLLSMKEIAAFARANGFDGIELWGAHARNLEASLIHGEEWLASFGLYAPMISDYLPTEGDTAVMRARGVALCQRARRWGAAKIRTFAGTKGSLETSASEWARLAVRLRELSAIAADHGVTLLVETHPRTLADRLASTIRLVEDVSHPAFGLNFDVLHVWEGGDDPLEALAALKPVVRHFHLKNVRSREDLRVFDPANVYAAAGRREGMTRLTEGALDFGPVLAALAEDPSAEASLEWFGDDCFDTLAHDARMARALAGAKPSVERRQPAA
ncbi:sugar phosphate isomerase/epimerase family protein [Chenggangzhangella methanolivorans]|uniref:Sugar phosphate isomerase/epimerase n=1 Tax=Chenggangzhangella methanolivorans TaxID=1437009 RepID=A0A9E6ULB3_9HYPH|nr:sugar phosphate isomerase/epimerase [Chenggangzhangella methanolivorans]QZN98740.1 sugar phosphate isomerase/epimerase [Chenggangzhangella methanolivorans]